MEKHLPFVAEKKRMRTLTSPTQPTLHFFYEVLSCLTIRFDVFRRKILA